MSSLVLIPDRLEPPADIEKEVFGRQAEILLCQARDSRQIDPQYWNNCDAVLAWHDLVYDQALLSQMQKCKVLVRVGVGYDNVDLKAAEQMGIAVCNIPDYGTEDVADHAMALMLSLLRGIEAYHKAARNGSWEWTAAPALRRIQGLKLGIIGLGRIGTAVALRARAFGLNIGFFDPYKQDGYEKALGIRRFPNLSDLAAESDIVSIHTPLTPETENLVDHHFVATCKSGVILINTSRGKVVDTDALATGLMENEIAAAGLDVLANEPPDSRHPLINAWQQQENWLNGRLIITPHAAFYNQDSVREMRRKAAQEALRVLQGNAPRNRII